MAEGGIFLDILTRLNLASVDRVLKDVNTAMREGGVRGGKAFSEGFRLDGAALQFRELTEASEQAYRGMQRGLENLQVQESRINDLRARNFKSNTEIMIAAQRDFDASLMNSMKLMEASNVKAAESRAARTAALDTAAWRRQNYDEPEERGRGGRTPPVVPFSRLGNTLGIGATIGAVAGGADAIKQSAQFQDSINRLVTVTQELPGNIKMIQDRIAQIAVKTGYNPQELATVALQGEKRGYKGQDLGKLLDVTAQLSREEKIPLEQALQGIAITAQNYHIPPDQLANIASQLNVAVGKSGTTMQGFVGALPSVEQRAAAAGISREQTWGVLAQMTRSGLSPERAAMNEDNLIRSLAGLNGPARDMINTLFAQSGAKNGTGKPMTAADISNNLGGPNGLGITGAVNTIMNKGVLPNLTEGQRVLLPTVFKNTQSAENIEQMIASFTNPKSVAFANSASIQGGAMSPMQVSTAATKAGVPKEDISRMRDLAKAEQVQHGFGAQLKGRDSDVQSIANVLRKAFGTAEASRAAMIIGAGDNPKLAQAETAKSVSDIAGAHADDKGNVEGFAKAMDTTLAQADRAKAAWHDVAITLGDQLSPAVKDAMSGLAEFGDWLSQHQGVLDAFAGTLTTIAGIWAGKKLFNGIKSLVEPTADLAKFIGGKASGIMPNTNVITNPYAGGAAGAAGGGAELASGVVSGAKEGAATLGGGVVAGAKEGAPILSGGVAGASKEAAPALTAGVTEGGKGAGVVIAEAMVGAGKSAGVEIGASMTRAGAEASGGFAGALRGAAGPLTAAILGADAVDSTINKVDKAHPAAAPWLSILQNSPTGVGAWHWGKKAYDWATGSGGGHAHGGIVGYEGGTGKVANPYSQPLMGMPDMKRDSILGMLPGGIPVGLRGGEGILTPDAVSAIGGKSAVDSLNNNPWSNPMKVATSFYGSFADGVAKYSPYGKYLKATSQSLNSLEEAFEQANEIHGEGDGKKTRVVNPGDPLSVMSKGRFDIQGGQWPTTESGAPRDKKQIVDAVKQAYLAAGFDPAQWHDLEHIIGKESSWNPTARNKSGAFGLGQFLGHEGDKYGAMGAYTNDPSRQGAAMMQYIKDRYGNPANAWQFWKAHNWYSGGGVIGFDQGGITPTFWDPGRKNPIDTNGPHKNTFDRGIDAPMMPRDGMGVSPTPRTPFGFTSPGPDNDPIFGGIPNPGWGIYNPPAPQWGGGSQGASRGGVIGYSTGGIVGFSGGGGVPLSPWGPTPPPPPGPAPISGPPSPANGLAPLDTGGKPPSATAPSPGPPSPANGLAPLDTGGLPPGAKPPPGGSSFSGVGGISGGKPDVSDKEAIPTPRAALTPPGTDPGTFSSSDDRSIHDSPSRTGGTENTSKGFGVGGGIIGSIEGAAQSAISAAGLAADASGGMGGGSAGAAAANQALQIGFQLANRAIGYGGQLVGILGSGLLETFLPNDSKLADPTRNLFGKVALGIAGAHPTPSNMAGSSAMQLQPKQDLDEGAQAAKQVMPMVHMDHPEIHNHGQQDWGGMHTAINQALFGMGGMGG